ncbi:hypothetical protein D3C86_2230640 [compost metagenome]
MVPVDLLVQHLLAHCPDLRIHAVLPDHRLPVPCPLADRHLFLLPLHPPQPH